MGSHCLLQGIFLPHCWQIVYHLSHEGSPATTMQLSPKISATGLGAEEGIWQGLETNVLSVTYCLCVPRKHMFITHLFSHLHVNHLPSFWSPNPIPSMFSLVFCCRWCLTRGLWTLVNYSVFLGLFHVYMLLNFFVCFTPVKLSHANYLLDQPEEPKRVKGSSFLSHTSSHSKKHKGQPSQDTCYQ